MLPATGTTLALSTLFLGCAARGPAVGSPPVPDRAALGVRVLTMDEGIVLQKVHPGTGADRAGLVPGDMIVSVDGVEVRDGPDAARFALRGPVGSQAELVVRAPLTGDYRSVSVERGLSKEPAEIEKLPSEILAVRRALLRQGPGAVKRAIKAAEARDWAGYAPSDAVGAQLDTARRRRLRSAVAAAKVLHGSHPDDHALHRTIGSVWFELGDAEKTLEAHALSMATRPPDAWDPGAPDALRGDAGGNPLGRSQQIVSLVDLKRREEANAIARELFVSWDDPVLRADLGMAPLVQPIDWSAALPPVESFDVTTLSGSRWSLDDHRGQVVVLTFFATWCGPCRMEMPELEALQRSLPELQILAVSTDAPEDVGKLPGFVRDVGVTYPVAHAPTIGRRFQVSSIPTVRVLDREGSLVYSHTGFSRPSMNKLRRVVENTLADNTGTGEAILGEAWTAGRAELVGFLGIPGTDDVVVADGEVAVGRDQAPPLVLARKPADGDGLFNPGGGERVAWLEGPVTARPGESWVRAWTPSGRLRFTVTTPTPVRDLAADAETLWVALREEVVAVDALGRLAWRIDGGASDLAPHPDGGVWAIDGVHRRHLQADGSVGAIVPADDATHVDGHGRVASTGFVDVQTGRFGPDGALRTVVSRDDGVVVGLDGAGRPAFTWALEDPPHLAVADADGDGQDELLVAIRRQGLATVSLSLP